MTNSIALTTNRVGRRRLCRIAGSQMRVEPATTCKETSVRHAPRIMPTGPGIGMIAGIVSIRRTSPRLAGPSRSTSSPRVIVSLSRMACARPARVWDARPALGGARSMASALGNAAWIAVRCTRHRWKGRDWNRDIVVISDTSRLPPHPCWPALATWPRVLIRLQITPAAMMPKVTPSEMAAGNFSSPSRSATKIFEPMKTSTIASAGLR